MTHIKKELSGHYGFNLYSTLCGDALDCSAAPQPIRAEHDLRSISLQWSRGGQSRPLNRINAAVAGYYTFSHVSLSRFTPKTHG